jgi:hypothetical protein
MAYKYAYNEEEEKKEYKPAPLQTNRKIWKLVILDLLTLGVYGIIFFIPFSFDLDKISPKKDGSKTMSYLFVYLLSSVTFAIILHIWFYQITERVEEALNERGINYDFGTSTFWTWYIAGSFILVGRIVYLHKLCKAMNLLCEDYNKKIA